MHLSSQVMLTTGDEVALAGTAAKSAEALRLNDTISYRNFTAQTDLVVNLTIK